MLDVLKRASLPELLKLAHAEMDGNQFSSAEKTLTKIINSCATPFARDYLSRAFVREHLGKYDDALKDVARGEVLPNIHPQTHEILPFAHPITVQRARLRKASIYSKQKDFDQANGTSTFAHTSTCARLSHVHAAPPVLPCSFVARCSVLKEMIRWILELEPNYKPALELQTRIKERAKQAGAEAKAAVAPQQKDQPQ